MVGRTLSVRPGLSVPSSCRGFGVGSLSSLSLADRSFLSWSDDPDFELASDESLCSAGVSIHRRKVLCVTRGEPFMGLERGLNGGWVWMPDGSAKLLGGAGGERLCKKGSLRAAVAVSSFSERCPAKSSELLYSELLVFAK